VHFVSKDQQRQYKACIEINFIAQYYAQVNQLQNRGCKRKRRRNGNVVANLGISHFKVMQDDTWTPSFASEIHVREEARRFRLSNQCKSCVAENSESKIISSKVRSMRTCGRTLARRGESPPRGISDRVGHHPVCYRLIKIPISDLPMVEVRNHGQRVRNIVIMCVHACHIDP